MILSTGESMLSYADRLRDPRRNFAAIVFVVTFHALLIRGW
jgi:hypothetical protein